MAAMQLRREFASREPRLAFAYLLKQGLGDQR